MKSVNISNNVLFLGDGLSSICFVVINRLHILYTLERVFYIKNRHKGNINMEYFHYQNISYLRPVVVRLLRETKVLI